MEKITCQFFCIYLFVWISVIESIWHAQFKFAKPVCNILYLGLVEREFFNAPITRTPAMFLNALLNHIVFNLNVSQFINQTKHPAMCCSADALPGWQSPGPAAALNALSEAGDGLSGGGNIWWVNINQTDTTTMAPGIAQRSISHQYPNWYPSACSNTTAIGYEQSMMCHGGSVIECRATAEKAA